LIKISIAGCIIKKHVFDLTHSTWIFVDSPGELFLINISVISFLGIIKHELSSSFQKSIQQLSNTDDSENIVWGPDHQKPAEDGSIRFPHRNGYKRHIIVNLFSSDDGHAKFDQLLTREMCQDSKKRKNQQITINEVDEKLSKMFGNMPEPDLAIFFGSVCCTMGFMPWHIRLTEFIQISHKLRDLSLDKYLRVLYKYAKCEQRFGK
jgi:hypothetical protein